MFVGGYAFFIVVFQVRSVDDSNDGNEDVDVDEVCIFKCVLFFSIIYG